MGSVEADESALEENGINSPIERTNSEDTLDSPTVPELEIPGPVQDIIYRIEQAQASRVREVSHELEAYRWDLLKQDSFTSLKNRGYWPRGRNTDTHTSLVRSQIPEAAGGWPWQSQHPGIPVGLQSLLVCMRTGMVIVQTRHNHGTQHLWVSGLGTSWVGSGCNTCSCTQG